MKILIHSNAPHTKTGYGVQCALLAERLHDAGHDVAISATYGQQGATGAWRPENPRNPELWDKPIRVYQCGWQVNGLDIIHNHALHWFDGDPKAGWIIPLLDVWALTENTLLADFNVAAWTPVDHYPVPPGVIAFFERSGAHPIAMSRFGEKALTDAGLDCSYVPLTIDTQVYKPTPTLTHPAHGDLDGRTLIGVADEPFLVGMVAMNKDPGDRKGFNEAFAAFGAFHRRHPDSVLYVHSDWKGMGTSFDLKELATACGIPAHAIKFPDTYAYQTGFSGEMMACIYTALDVLLAPSHGEGFCVPLVEAQACGTPVIVTDFSAQPELVGAGVKVLGQQLWDPAQHSFYIVPFVNDLVAVLEDAYTWELDKAAEPAMVKAQEYDTDRVFDLLWRPVLDLMDAEPEALDCERPDMDRVAVLIPALKRPQNVERLMASLAATPEATAYYVCDPDDDAQIAAAEKHGAVVLHQGGTFAEKINHAYRETSEPWLFVCGDDVEFDPRWLCEARQVADAHVVGTNDSHPGRVRNPDVAKGEHADHFLISRPYVDTYGACLDGPGVLAPECYGHWFVDLEIVGLAKARGTFQPCLTSVVEHHHPGYDGASRDSVYLKAMALSGGDQDTFKERLPLLKMQRSTIKKAS